MGECTTAFTNDGASVCFENGVKTKGTFMVGVELSFTVQTFNPDGSVCFANDGMSMGDAIQVTYRDAAGTVFADSSLNRAAMTLSVTCTGAAPVTINLATCGGPGMMMPGMMMSGMMMPMCMGTAPCM
jgi:hypothetical protein